MRRTATITLAAFVNLLAVAARAQETTPECTTVTTTTVTCKGSAAPLAVPAAEPPAPARIAQPFPRLDDEVPDARLYLPPQRSHVEEQPRYGLLVTGLAIFGANYLMNLSVAYLGGETTFAIPVAGPVLWGSRSGNSDCSDCSSDRSMMGLLVFDSLVQAAGLAMALAGALTRSRVTVFDKVAFAPMAGPGGSGLAVMGSF